MNMENEKLTCELCGREVHEGDYITSSEGDVVCKCCAFDEIEQGYYYLLRVVRHLCDAIQASRGSILAMDDVLQKMPDEVVYQIMELDDANDTKAEA